MASQKNSKPKANQDGWLIEEVGGEVLAYNVERHRVHCLNNTAVRIWKVCTGRRSIEQIAAELDIGLDPAARELVVRNAIGQFQRIGLVEATDGVLPNMSRRELARKIGIGVAAGIALPLVTSILAPPAYAATSCGGHPGMTCSGSTPHCCCNPICHCVANCGSACPGKVTCM